MQGVDANGQSWENVKTQLYKFWKRAVDFADSTFGAESSTSLTKTSSVKRILPDPCPLTIVSGVKSTLIISSYGDASKPISVYANGESGDPIQSSVGLRLNIAKVTCNFSIGLDDIGVHVSLTDGTRTNSIGARINLSEFKIGIEWESAERNNNLITTAYTNVSINGTLGVMFFLALTTGQTEPATYGYGG